MLGKMSTRLGSGCGFGWKVPLCRFWRSLFLSSEYVAPRERKGIISYGLVEGGRRLVSVERQTAIAFEGYLRTSQ